MGFNSRKQDSTEGKVSTHVEPVLCTARVKEPGSTESKVSTPVEPALCIAPRRYLRRARKSRRYSRSRIHFSPSARDMDAQNRWSHTLVDIIKFSYTWIITDFSSYCEETVVLKSANFSTGVDGELTWCLRASPQGLDADSEEYMSLSLRLVSCNESEVSAKFKFSILDIGGEAIKIAESPRTYRFVQGEDWGFIKFIQRNYLLNETNGLLHNDRLSIRCEVTAATKSITVSDRDSAKQFKVPEQRLSNDLGAMLHTRKFADVILSAGGREFHAHKVILAAHSVVFSAMFEHGMMEKNTNRVEIMDIDCEVLGEMLLYIYMGHAPNLKTMADKMLIVADKYALERLKVECEEILVANLTVGTAADILILADMHTANQLKVHTLNFIGIHATRVTETLGFKNMAQHQPYLVVEAFKALSAQHVLSFTSSRERMKHNS